MTDFKVTLDRVEENVAVMLLRDDEKIRINIPCILLPEEARKATFLILQLSETCKRQKPQRKE